MATAAVKKSWSDRRHCSREPTGRRQSKRPLEHLQPHEAGITFAMAFESCCHDEVSELTLSMSTTMAQPSQPEQMRARNSFTGETPILQPLGCAKTTRSPPHYRHSPCCCFCQKSSFILPPKHKHSGPLQSGKCVGLRSTDSLCTKMKTASANTDVSQLFIVTRTCKCPLTVSRAHYLEPSLGRVAVRLCFQPRPTFKWGKKPTPTTKEQLTH